MRGLGGLPRPGSRTPGRSSLRESSSAPSRRQLRQLGSEAERSLVVINAYNRLTPGPIIEHDPPQGSIRGHSFGVWNLRRHSVAGRVDLTRFTRARAILR